MIRNAILWAVLILGPFVLFGAFGDSLVAWAIVDDPQAASARPTGEPQTASNGSPSFLPVSGIAADNSGHFRVTAAINGTSIMMIVDTGATTVVLREADARLSGLTLSNESFTGTANTAAGPVKVAPITLDRVSVNGIERRNVSAVVAQGSALPASLLGQSYLSSLGEVRIANGQLTLRD